MSSFQNNVDDDDDDDDDDLQHVYNCKQQKF
jgi:hypothetical protein